MTLSYILVFLGCCREGGGWHPRLGSEASYFLADIGRRPKSVQLSKSTYLPLFLLKSNICHLDREMKAKTAGERCNHALERDEQLKSLIQRRLAAPENTDATATGCCAENDKARIQAYNHYYSMG